jgi:thioredoxin reductase (NADPH)
VKYATYRKKWVYNLSMTNEVFTGSTAISEDALSTEQVAVVGNNAIIIGSGPAGCTAAIYLARAGLEPIVFASSLQIGGTLVNAMDIENYPGFPEATSGFELMSRMQEQAEKFGAKFLYEDIKSVDLTGRMTAGLKRVTTAEGKKYHSRTIIIATGSKRRSLNVPGERQCQGKGVSYCATCDGFFFKNKKLIVVGGGDSAMEEALVLTRFASMVYLVHRSENFRASSVLLERVQKNPKITILTNKTVDQILDTDGTVSGVVLHDTVTETDENFSTDGVFVAIGQDPRVDVFQGALELDNKGHIWVNGAGTHTSVPGVFAAGDVVDPVYKQAITAAGGGCRAAIDAENYLFESGAI